jgi:hypothetical protein
MLAGLHLPAGNNLSSVFRYPNRNLSFLGPQEINTTIRDLLPENHRAAFHHDICEQTPTALIKGLWFKIIQRPKHFLLQNRISKKGWLEMIDPMGSLLSWSVTNIHVS